MRRQVAGGYLILGSWGQIDRFRKTLVIFGKRSIFRIKGTRDLYTFTTAWQLALPLTPC